jgi:glycosyltransferase involved in cell wall biosynthesis
MAEVTTMVMTTYNRVELTKQTIPNIYDTTKIDFNLIIIDNGSSDETVDYLKSLNYNNLKLILSKENHGIATARNIGIYESDKSNTDWYVCLDNDILLPDNAIEQCIDILKSNKEYSMIGVNYENKNFPIVDLNGFKFQEKPSPGNLGSATIVFSKKIRKMFGFFNTNYSRNYGLEDTSYSLRQRATGFKLGYILENGIHIGDNEDPNSEYRKMKTREHDAYLAKYQEDVRKYFSTKQVYVSWTPDENVKELLGE